MGGMITSIDPEAVYSYIFQRACGRHQYRLPKCQPLTPPHTNHHHSVVFQHRPLPLPEAFTKPDLCSHSSTISVSHRVKAGDSVLTSSFASIPALVDTSPTTAQTTRSQSISWKLP